MDDPGSRVRASAATVAPIVTPLVAAVLVVSLAGWRSTATAAAPQDDGVRGALLSVSGSGPSDAWAVGGTSKDYPLKPKGFFVHWDGAAWNVAAVAVPGKQSSMLGVWEHSAGDAWAVGWYAPKDVRKALAMHWDGSDWAETDLPAPKNLLLTAVTGTSSDDVWAVGASSDRANASVVLHWNGSNWQQVGTANGYLLSVSAVSSDDVWVGGFAVDPKSHDRTTLLQHWDGSSWTAADSPNPDAKLNSLYGVAALPKGRAWAVGAFGGRESMARSGRDEKTLALGWDGAQWSKVKSPNPDPAQNQLNGIDAVSSSDVWAVGHQGSGEQATLIERWNGEKWKVVTSASPDGPSTLVGVDATGSANAWAVGSFVTGKGRYKPFVEQWDGQTWEMAAIASS